jgi:hypothetical protein
MEKNSKNCEVGGYHLSTFFIKISMASITTRITSEQLLKRPQKNSNASGYVIT